MAELRSLSKARDIRGRSGRSDLIRSEFQQKLIGDIKKIVDNFSSGFGSARGFRFKKSKSPALEDIASDELRKLKSVAGDRQFTNRLVDKNLEVSMRLIRAKEVGNVRQRLLPAAESRIERTLGKFEDSTLELFDKLKRLKRNAKFERKFLGKKKDVAEESLRDITLQGRRGSEFIDEAIRTETSKRLKAIFKKLERGSIVSDR